MNDSGLHRALPPQKLFLIGFSVLESKIGLRLPLSSWAAANGYDLKIFGFGGMHIDNMPMILDLISSQFDLSDAIVLLDLQSSGIRGWFDPEIHSFFAQEMMRRLVKFSCRPVLLNFFRRDVDYRDDQFIAFLKSFTDVYGIPVLDAASDLQEGFATGRLSVDHYFSDVVHTTDLSSSYYCERIADFLNTSEIPYCNPNGGEGRIALSVKPLADLSDKFPFRIDRNGLLIPFREVAEGRHLTLELDPGLTLIAITTVWGPQTGFMRVTADGLDKEIRCFDNFCYYPRMTTQSLNLKAGALRIETLSKLPDIELLKGERAAGARMNYFGHLVYRSDYMDI